MKEDFNVPGYHYMTDEEIAGSLQNEPEEEEGEEATGAQQGPSLAAGLEAISTCLRLINNVGDPLAEPYEGLHIMRMKILKLQDGKQVQQKITFFQPLSPHHGRGIAHSLRNQLHPPLQCYPPLQCNPPLQPVSISCWMHLQGKTAPGHPRMASTKQRGQRTWPQQFLSLHPRFWKLFLMTV